MASVQTETAVQVLSELFGDPSWKTNPKTGFNREAFLAGWDEELSRYSEEQVKTACLRYGKFSKTNTFPKLAHILAQLVDVVPEKKENATETKENSFMKDFFEFRSRCVIDGVDNHLCLSCDVDEALNRTLEDIDAEFPPNNHWEERNSSELVNIGLINGVLWDKLNAHLLNVLKQRSFYKPTGDSSMCFDVPDQFKYTGKENQPLFNLT